MPTGTVKWFNNAKGYGFILSDQDQSDIFAHFSAIEMEGYRTLKAGQQVKFEQVDGDKGAQALNISVAESSSSEESAANESSSDTSASEPEAIVAEAAEVTESEELTEDEAASI